MKKIRIAFSDFWDVFDPNDNFITDALREKFEVEIGKDPDFVFCSIFGRKYLKYDCARIYYTGENIAPDFNLVDYAMGFPDIDFYDRYLRLPHYVLYPRACELAQKKPSLPDRELTDRKFCSYVISNSICAPERTALLEKLSQYKELASGGRYRNNVGGPVADKIEFSKGYKFSIAFENSGSRGYTTEKIMESFAADTVPIYWGNPDIAKEFDPQSFINCHDFDSFDNVVEYVKKVDNDDELYLKMVKTPITSKGYEAAKCLDKSYVSDYLFKICSQDPDKAVRRNTIYQGKYYEDEAKFHEKIDRVLYTPRRAVRALKNRLNK